MNGLIESPQGVKPNARPFTRTRADSRIDVCLGCNAHLGIGYQDVFISLTAPVLEQYRIGEIALTKNAALR